MKGRDLLGLSLPEFVSEIAAWGERSFRAQQVWEWVWKRLETDFAVMTNLDRGLRGRLTGAFTITLPTVVVCQGDEEEGTGKALLALDDGQEVEAVLLQEDRRRTVCVSTQVGCPVGCSFCATGRMGYVRDLTAGEIAAQVLHFARVLQHAGEEVTHVVVMGMGEPLFNYDATLRAIRNLNDPQGFALGARRITVSTVGVVPGILRLAEEALQVNLAVSLHSPDEDLRRQLVPLSERWPLREVLAAADHYAGRTGRRVSYEYVLLREVNDRWKDAQALSRLLRGRLAHVNLIPFNPASGLPYKRPEDGRVDAFRRLLIGSGVDATVRRSRGVRIQAGCGQLRTRRVGLPAVPHEIDRVG